MKIIKILVPASIFVLMAACGSEKVIDGESAESFKSSYNKIVEDLDPGTKVAFEDAVNLITKKHLDFDEMLKGGNERVQRKIRGEIDGLTADQVIQIAGRAKKELDEKLIREEFAEYEELSKKKELAAENKKMLALFRVIDSKFYVEEREFRGLQPVIEIAVKNGTNAPVSRAYFTGKLVSDGRAVPWHVEKFNYVIAGGIEPGELSSWELLPNIFSEWGKLKAPEGSEFVVEVEKLVGADDKELFSEPKFTESDQERMDELKKKHDIKEKEEIAPPAPQPAQPSTVVNTTQGKASK